MIDTTEAKKVFTEKLNASNSLDEALLKFGWTIYRLAYNEGLSDGKFIEDAKPFEVEANV